jgi:hypothetical protein
MERERMEQVHLTWEIYIEPIASWELIKEEIKIFVEEKKNK